MNRVIRTNLKRITSLVLAGAMFMGMDIPYCANAVYAQEVVIAEESTDAAAFAVSESEVGEEVITSDVESEVVAEDMVHFDDPNFYMYLRGFWHNGGSIAP